MLFAGPPGNTSNEHMRRLVCPPGGCDLSLLPFQSACVCRVSQNDATSLKEALEEPAGLKMGDDRDRQQEVIVKALQLFGLREYRLIFEPGTDSKALVAWNDTTILVSFRGTASMKTAKLDLEVSAPAHILCIPSRGNWHIFLDWSD